MYQLLALAFAVAAAAAGHPPGSGWSKTNDIPDASGGREVASAKLLPTVGEVAKFSIYQLCTKAGQPNFEETGTIQVDNKREVTPKTLAHLVNLRTEPRKLGFVVFGQAESGWACKARWKRLPH